MALGPLCWVLMLLAADFAAVLNARLLQPKESITPNCSRYQLPACPRDLFPVCGSDMITYPNECALCEKMREVGHEMKIIREGPCW